MFVSKNSDEIVKGKVLSLFLSLYSSGSDAFLYSSCVLDLWGKSLSLIHEYLKNVCVCAIVLSSAALLVFYCRSSIPSTNAAYSSSVGSGHPFSSK